MRLIFQRDVDGASGDVYFMRLAGLSTETKPTENVATGSIFIEVDTDKKCIYDEDSMSWTEEPAAVDPEAISEAVEDWLDDHPEATTTVADGAITYAKLDSSLKGSVDDVSDLKNDFDNYFTPTNLAENVTYAGYYYVNYSDGTNKSGSSYKASDYIDITGCEKIIYSRLYTTSSTSYAGIAFYDENKGFIEDSGIPAVFSQSADHFELKVATVPTGAKYIRLTGKRTGTAASAPVEVYEYKDYSSKIQQRVEENTERIGQITAENENHNNFYFNPLTKDGYLRINPEDCVRGGWSSYAESDNRSYRVRCKKDFIFDRDIIILSDYGFRVCVYYSTGGTLKSGSRIIVPANTMFHLYTRRYTNEDESETANIETFISKIKISTALSPIELLTPTFSDVSMFERIGIGGDSYASSGGIISGKTNLSWGKNLERQSGITVDIYAKSGDTVMDWVVNQTKGLPALIAGEECGLYWLQHGINGTSTAASLGTPDDMETNPHPNTFYGKYTEAIEAIKTTFPRARIVLATIIGTSFGVAQENYVNANAAIKAIAQYCEVPCIDIFEDDFFRSHFYDQYMQSQHPTAMVNAGMAMAYRRLLSKCIQNNPEYFMYYGTD